MSNIMFSVIVPCYNVEQYIDECVQSLINQEYSNFEILLIDDGSTDGTSELCDCWGRKDSRIHTFHKENGGLSDARNYGIKKAAGDYLVFVDGDDYISVKALSAFSQVAGSIPDVIITRLTEYYETKGILQRDINMEDMIAPVPTRMEAIKWNMDHSQNTWPSVKNILSRSFVQKHQLRFKEGFLHEDIDWTSRVFCLAQSYVSCPIEWYYHRMKRDGSITNMVTSKRITDVVCMARDIAESPLWEQCDPKEKEIITNRVMRSVYASLSNYKYLNDNGKKEVQDSVRDNRKLFNYAPHMRHKAFVFVMRIFGVSAALSLIP